MGFIRDLFGSKPKSATRPGGPAAHQLSGHERGNPITALLHEWGLPIDEPRCVIEERNGIGRDPYYDWPTLMVPEARQLPGAMRPWAVSVHDRIPPQFPITQFSGLVWFEDDAEANLRRTADHIAEALGQAPIRRRWNTVVAEWRSDLAEITLTAWPQHLQDGLLSNPSHERHPRLRHACHVQVGTGFCPTLSDKERAWVETSLMVRPMATGGNPPQSKAPHENYLEYVRRLDGLKHMETGLRFSGDGEALVLISSHLFVIPRTSIQRLEVMRLTPAKGAGGASLHAICDSTAPQGDGQSIFLAEDIQTDGLNEFAGDLAERLGCRLDIGPAYADC